MKAHAGQVSRGTGRAHKEQEVLCIPGHVVNRADEGCRRERKTDARDALAITEQACIRREPDAVRRRVPLELGLFTGRRAGVVCYRTRAINRLRCTLSSVFPALERALYWLALDRSSC